MVIMVRHQVAWSQLQSEYSCISLIVSIIVFVFINTLLGPFLSADCLFVPVGGEAMCDLMRDQYYCANFCGNRWNRIGMRAISSSVDSTMWSHLLHTAKHFQNKMKCPLLWSEYPVWFELCLACSVHYTAYTVIMLVDSVICIVLFGQTFSHIQRLLK